MKELIEIQSTLKAPKGQKNTFGNYKYRSAEDILEAVKPLLKENECSLTISDEMVEVGGRIYVKATAKIESHKTGSNTYREANGFAREPESQKGMSESQITGTASSYARKYALNGLFAIDDTKDADTNEHKTESESKEEKQVYTQKKFFNYEDLVEVSEAGNVTLEEIGKIIKQDGFTVSKNAKTAIAHYVNTGEVKKDLFFNK